MSSRIAWPRRYLWLHEYARSKPEAVFDYKESWDSIRYFVHGKIFGLLLRNAADGLLLTLKCDPYLSLGFRNEYPTVIPGWHMNKLHWISLCLKGRTPEDVCRQLVDISYDLVWQGLPGKVKGEGRRPKIPVPEWEL